jgi:hypothetical protein
VSKNTENAYIEWLRKERTRCFNTPIVSSEKSSWSLKTSFWKQNCPTNSKMIMVFMVFGLLAWISKNHKEIFHDRFWIYWKNDVFKLQKFFSELEIRLFLENGFGSYQKFLNLQISDETRHANKIPKTILKTRLKTKEITYNLVFVKYLVVFFRSHSGIFSVFRRFIENYLKNLTYSGKS